MYSVDWSEQWGGMHKHVDHGDSVVSKKHWALAGPRASHEGRDEISVLSYLF